MNENPVDRNEKKIYRLSGICVLLAASSLVVPRFVPNVEGGFASGAMAVLTLLAMLGVTLLVALYLLVMTVRQYGDLSMKAKIAGSAPAIILAVVLLALFGFVSY